MVRRFNNFLKRYSLFLFYHYLLSLTFSRVKCILSYMRKTVIILMVILLTVLVIKFLPFLNRNTSFVNPLGKITPVEKPLLAYTFENLRITKFPVNQINLGRKIAETTDSSSQMFYFSVPDKPNSKKMEKVSGLMNLPNTSGTYPVIVMFRGFASQESYVSGIGTQHAAEVFAKNGFITLAPDFLGYGESGKPAKDAFEERFQTYTTTLTLLSSLSTLNKGLEASYSGEIKAGINKIGIWGHSNGGQIALSTLIISGETYPTVLWAPVSKSFPYSILYYTDEFDDQGKLLRKALADFENNYDTEKYSLTNYLKLIKAPVSIHQGTNDQEVPVWWSDELVSQLKKDKIDVSYITYPGADHNLLPSGWNNAVLGAITFYQDHFK